MSLGAFFEQWLYNPGYPKIKASFSYDEKHKLGSLKIEQNQVDEKKKIHFNVSRADSLALYAFTRDCEIGIDIEHIRDVSEMDNIVERFFSVRENAVFHALPKSKRKKAFFLIGRRAF